MSDAPTIKLSAPLPGNALEARLTWRRERGGLRGDQEVARSDATHATLWVKGLDGRGLERRVSLEDAEAFLGAARELAARTAEREARTARDGEAEAGHREQIAAALRVRCPHCQVQRAYVGPQSPGYHEYACPRCGSVELFRAGVLDHPLAHTGDGA
jgi:DNA-directed RNA polymerase subunit RPC12/RpoP